MKKSTTLTMLMLTAFCQINATDLFTPVQKTDLRLPSVPLRGLL